MRQVVGALPNGLPAVCYGQWSPTYATTNPGWAGGKLQLRAALWSAPIAIKVVRPTFRISRG